MGVVGSGIHIHLCLEMASVASIFSSSLLTYDLPTYDPRQGAQNRGQRGYLNGSSMNAAEVPMKQAELWWIHSLLSVREEDALGLPQTLISCEEALLSKLLSRISLFSDIKL